MLPFPPLETLLVLPFTEACIEAANVDEDPEALLFEMTDVVEAVDAAAEAATAADRFEKG